MALIENKLQAIFIPFVEFKSSAFFKNYPQRTLYSLRYNEKKLVSAKDRFIDMATSAIFSR